MPRGVLLLALSAIPALLAAIGCEKPAPPAEAKAPPFRPLTHAEPIGPLPTFVGTSTVDSIQKNDSLSVALGRHGIGGLDVDGVVRALDGQFDFRHARIGHEFELTKDDEGKLEWFRYQTGPTQIFHVVRDSDGVLMGTREDVRIDHVTEFAKGEIRHSLYLAMKAAGEGDALVLTFVDLFAWDIDFFTETQKGDRFRLVFEKNLVNGAVIGYGRILGAEYHRASGGKHRAFHYTRKDGKGGYYTDDGTSVKKAFLRSPIQFASITSRFGRRRHPVLKYTRMHKGVDYGAPRGTAIWAIGDGVIRYAGRKGGYGNVVYIDHANGISSRYAHLKGFGRGIRRGVRVQQKRIIGYVGSTGLATGPHLHFETLKKGRHVNPLRMTVPPAPPIPKDELERFKATIQEVQALLDRGAVPDAPTKSL